MVGLAVGVDVVESVDLRRERVAERIGGAVAVLGRLDQVLLGKLKAFGLALAPFYERPQRRIEVLIARATTDRRRLARSRPLLLVLRWTERLV